MSEMLNSLIGKYKEEIPVYKVVLDINGHNRKSDVLYLWDRVDVLSVVKKYYSNQLGSGINIDSLYIHSVNCDINPYYKLGEIGSIMGWSISYSITRHNMMGGGNITIKEDMPSLIREARLERIGVI